MTSAAAPSRTGVGALPASLAVQAQPAIPCFDQLYELHFAFVWRSLRGLGVADGNVDDATQEVFLVAHRKLPDFEPRGSVMGWLFEIARRVAKDHRRSASRKAVHVELQEAAFVNDGADLQDQVATRQLLRAVENFTSRLSEENQAIFVLAQVEGLPVSEVSAMLGLNQNTAYTRLRVMRQDLDKTLANLGEPSRFGRGKS